MLIVCNRQKIDRKIVENVFEMTSFEIAQNKLNGNDNDSLKCGKDMIVVVKG